MKKKWIYLLILFVLVLVALFFIFNNRKGGTLNADSDFAIQDTSLVTKVFMADKNNNTVLLKKAEDGNWTVNDKYSAATPAMEIFLKTLMSIEIKSPVSKEAHENIVKNLAATAVKVEIYQTAYYIDLFDAIKWFPHEKLVKTYYVGFATQDNLGTFMLMEGSKEPYITHIPGFKGFLTTRFSPIEKDWRDHSIFDYRYKDILAVTLWIPESPEKSFRVEKTGPRDFQLYHLDKDATPLKENMPAYDTLKLMDYFSAFENIRYEALVDEIEPQMKDSILKAQPYHVLTIDLANGTNYTLKTWHKKGAPDNVDMDGNVLKWDPDRMFALTNKGEDFVLIQFFVFDRILSPIESFYPGLGEQKSQK